MRDLDSRFRLIQPETIKVWTSASSRRKPGRSWNCPGPARRLIGLAFFAHIGSVFSRRIHRHRWR